MGKSVSEELAYDYAKITLEQELRRFDSLDNKANKFLGFISVFLGVLVSLVGWGFDKFFPPVTVMQCCIVFLLFLIVFSLSLAWHYLFKSLKVAEMPTLKLDNVVCETLCKFEPDNISNIITSYKELLSVHKTAMVKKVEYVESAYNCISFGAIVTLITVFFMMVSQIL
ncbi:hypothetical protein [Shewanella japonica]|uniref:hypothetical protein n=1 Tax=Shewanella japonica TaxID=93973 RepID=UPI0024944EE8|nr:hypothetical protein [Shewanella japonica]